MLKTLAKFLFALVLLGCLGKSYYTQKPPRFIDAAEQTLFLGAFLNYTTTHYLDLELRASLKAHYSKGGALLAYKSSLNEAALYLVLSLDEYVRRELPVELFGRDNLELFLKGTFTLRKVRAVQGQPLYYAQRFPFEISLRASAQNFDAVSFKSLEQKLYAAVASELDHFFRYGTRKTPLSLY